MLKYHGQVAASGIGRGLTLYGDALGLNLVLADEGLQQYAAHAG